MKEIKKGDLLKMKKDFLVESFCQLQEEKKLVERELVRVRVRLALELDKKEVQLRIGDWTL